MKKLIALAAMLAAGTANATVITQSANFGYVTTDWTHTFSLNQFDSSLGTLNSVTIHYGGKVNSTFLIENVDAAPSNVTLAAGANLDFGLPVSDILTIAGSTNLALSAFDGGLDFTGASGANLLLTGNASSTLILNSSLAAFIGTGTWDVVVDAVDASTASGAIFLVSQIETSALADIEVVYDFTATPPNPAPEPATLALLGLGLAGLGMMRRRTK